MTTAPGPVFVSRGAVSKKRNNDTMRASDGGELPSLRDPRVRWMIALVLALQCYAWSRVQGYQLADSVEFMERARIFERGEQMIDAGAIRPFGFSFVLVPFFALADWFGLHDQRAVVWCVIVFQMLLGCVLAWRSMRIGAIVAGSAGAIAAGLFVACNPVFLQYSTQPVSDIAAGVCVAFALERVLERASFRRALVAGLWLALAFIVAYKTLLVSVTVFVAVLLRDRWKHSATWRGLSVGITLGLLLQSTLDWVMYGAFGASVGNYLAQNAGSVSMSVCAKLYRITDWDWVKRVGLRIMQMQGAYLETDYHEPVEITVRGLQSSWYYAIELPLFAVWPAIVVIAAGVLRAIVRPRWTIGILLCVLLACVFVMSNKGSKDFRLWLPLLPFVGALVAFGWEWIALGLRRITRVGAAATAALGAVVLVGFALHQLAKVNVRHYGGYWAAIDWVDARAKDSLRVRRERTRVTGHLGEPAPVRVGSAYNWAVFLRPSPLVEVVKLPWQLNMWKQYGERPDGGRVEKADDMAAIAELDVLLVHLPILSQNHDLMRWVNAHFEVVAAFYDQRTYEEIGPIYALERRTGSPRARTFFEVTPFTAGADDPARIAAAGGRRMDFTGADGERLELLGVEFDTLPPQGFGWITYRWRAITPLKRDWWVIDRITSRDEHNVWQNNHPPAYGTAPASQWSTGDVIAESHLVVPAQDAFKVNGRVRPFGGGYRRGDLIPTRTWMKVQAFDPASLEPGKVPVVTAELAPARPGEPLPIRSVPLSIQSGASEGSGETPDGIQFSADDFVRVAGFFVPVLAPWRVPDDGRPLPP